MPIDLDLGGAVCPDCWWGCRNAVHRLKAAGVYECERDRQEHPSEYPEVN